MTISPLFGRRIHIAGSIVEELAIATSTNVETARLFVEELVKVLVKKGATFVIPVDAEKLRAVDQAPICFDWLIWQTIYNNIVSRPANALNPLAIAVQHHKNEEQIPEQFHELWDSLRNSDLVKIENAAHWNMASKRMETQAKWGDILITLGGGEGVLFLANLYHEAGKPVIPLNFPLSLPEKGSQKLFNYGLSSINTTRLFRTTGSVDSHAWINRINFTSRKSITECVNDFICLLEALEKPKAFAVRLLNKDHPDFVKVQNFFDDVVEPILSHELGYELITIDGQRAYEDASIVQEIFTNLHRSSFVVADITGMRPNCFIELGYALGRGIPTMLTAMNGTDHPFDVSVFSGHHWKSDGLTQKNKNDFRCHWEAIKNRRPIVNLEPLIP